MPPPGEDLRLCGRGGRGVRLAVVIDASTVIVDDGLARSIERTLAADVGSFVCGMAARDPSTGASSIAIADGWLHFTGAHLFGNRGQGLGLDAPVSAGALERIAAFYVPLGLPAEVEVCPHAHHSLLDGLVERGYRPVGFRNVYTKVLEPAPAERYPTVRVVDDDGFAAWSEVILDGFGYENPTDRSRVAGWNRMLHDRADVMLVSDSDGDRMTGAANVVIHDTVASLGGTTTLPVARRQGVQLRLLRARLHIAAQMGCTTAIVTADPGSSSSRNVQRAGFVLAYTNVRLRRHTARSGSGTREGGPDERNSVSGARMRAARVRDGPDEGRTHEDGAPEARPGGRRRA